MLLALGLMLSPAAAQGDIQPFQRILLLIAGANNTGRFEGFGDIYSWQPGEAALTRETTYGYNDAPVISPDGTKAVYLSVASSYIEAVASGNDPTFGNGPLPTNVWLMYLTLPLNDPLRFVRIADQTTAMPLGAGDDLLVPRSRPVWSPDSAVVAWVERDVMAQSFSGRLITYDTRNGGVNILAEGLSLGFGDAGNWGVPALTGWGSHLAYTSVNAGVYPEPDSAGFGTTLDLIGANGGVTSLPVSYFNNMVDELTDLRWVQHNGQWRVAMQYPNLGWVILDAATGSYELLQSPPFARGIVDTGWTVRPSASGAGLDWYTPDGTLTVIGSEAPDTFTPSGVPIFIAPDGRLGTFGDGSIPTIPAGLSALAITWIPATWLTDGMASPIQPSIVVG